MTKEKYLLVGPIWLDTRPVVNDVPYARELRAARPEAEIEVQADPKQNQGTISQWGFFPLRSPVDLLS